MHSVQDYLQGLSTPVLKGVLWGWCDGHASCTDRDVLLMMETLRARGELDPALAAAAEKRLEEVGKARAEEEAALPGEKRKNLLILY